jgi:hypothetical protein
LSLVDFRKPFADLGLEVHAQRPKAVVFGLVEFLVPQLEKCISFLCEIARPGENNKDLI